MRVLLRCKQSRPTACDTQRPTSVYNGNCGRKAATVRVASCAANLVEPTCAINNTRPNIVYNVVSHVETLSNSSILYTLHLKARHGLPIKISHRRLLNRNDRQGERMTTVSLAVSTQYRGKPRQLGGQTDGI